jgi:hypothetical protein
MSNTTSEPGDKENQQWLDAIAGKPDSSADPMLNQQAAALRQALIKRSQEVISAVPDADPAGYERLLAELKRQGLLTDRPKANSFPFIQGVFTSLSALLKKGIDPPFRLFGGTGGAPIPAYWGVAATLVIGIGIVIQLSLHMQDQQEDTLRGGGTVLIVADPQTRANELVLGLKAAGVEPLVTVEPNGDINIQFPAQERVLDYLSSQRIEVAPVNGNASVLISKAK